LARYAGVSGGRTRSTNATTEGGGLGVEAMVPAIATKGASAGDDGGVACTHRAGAAAITRQQSGNPAAIELAGGSSCWPWQQAWHESLLRRQVDEPKLTHPMEMTIKSTEARCKTIRNTISLAHNSRDGEKFPPGAIAQSPAAGPNVAATQEIDGQRQEARDDGDDQKGAEDHH
jgi:hypothetical protein